MKYAPYFGKSPRYLNSLKKKTSFHGSRNIIGILIPKHPQQTAKIQ